MASTAAVIDLAGRVQARPSVAAASQTLCDEATAYLQCAQMAVGVVRSGETCCRLAAVSRSEGAVSPDRKETYLEAALDECLLRGEAAIWPPQAGAARHSLVTHKQLALRWNAPTVVSVPLRTHEGESDRRLARDCQIQRAGDFSLRIHAGSCAADGGIDSCESARRAWPTGTIWKV